MRASSFRRNTRLTSAAIRSGLGGSGCNNRANTSRICGTVRVGIFPPQPTLFQDQEPQRQQGQSHVVVPAHPTPHLVVAQPHSPLPCLQHLLDPVSPTVCHHHPLQRHRRTGVGQRVPHLRLPVDRADHHQPLVCPHTTVFLFGLHPRLQGLHHLGAFRPITDHQPPPPTRRLSTSPFVHPPPRWHATSRSQGFAPVADQGVARYVQHVAATASTQLGTESGGSTELVIRRHPAEGQVRRHSVEQRQADPPTLLEGHLLGHLGLLTPHHRLGPFLREVQLPIH